MKPSDAIQSWATFASVSPSTLTFFVRSGEGRGIQLHGDRSEQVLHPHISAYLAGPLGAAQQAVQRLAEPLRRRRA
jgi:hypothetical protein